MLNEFKDAAFHIDADNSDADVTARLSVVVFRRCRLYSFECNNWIHVIFVDINLVGIFYEGHLLFIQICILYVNIARHLSERRCSSLPFIFSQRDIYLLASLSSTKSILIFVERANANLARPISLFLPWPATIPLSISRWPRVLQPRDIVHVAATFEFESIRSPLGPARPVPLATARKDGERRMKDAGEARWTRREYPTTERVATRVHSWDRGNVPHGGSVLPRPPSAAPSPILPAHVSRSVYLFLSCLPPSHSVPRAPAAAPSPSRLAPVSTAFPPPPPPLRSALAPAIPHPRPLLFLLSFP